MHKVIGIKILATNRSINPLNIKHNHGYGACHPPVRFLIEQKNSPKDNTSKIRLYRSAIRDAMIKKNACIIFFSIIYWHHALFDSSIILDWIKKAVNFSENSCSITSTCLKLYHKYSIVCKFCCEIHMFYSKMDVCFSTKNNSLLKK